MTSTQHESAQVQQALRLLPGRTTEETARLEEVVVEAYASRVRSISHRYSRRGLDVEDLEQIACAALLGAIRRYRADRGDFMSFVAVTVRGEIRKAFRDQAWTVRPPRRVQELKLRVGQAREDIEAHGHSASAAHIADELGCARSEVEEAMASGACFRPDSLDAAVTVDGRRRGDDVAAPEDAMAVVEQWHSLSRWCQGLTDRDRRLLGHRFVDGMTQLEIGREVGLSQMQVSRELARILALLRERAEGSQDVLRSA